MPVFFGTTVYGGKVAFRPALVKLAHAGRGRRPIVPIVLGLGASQLTQPSRTQP
jgi:hypothetical protein